MDYTTNLERLLWSYATRSVVKGSLKTRTSTKRREVRMFRTQNQIKITVEALKRLGILKDIKNPQGLYIYVWDIDKEQSSAIGVFNPMDITLDLFRRVKEIAIEEMMS